MSTSACIPEPKHSLGFKHVLVATDFSAASERALACALPIVKRCGSDLSIIHAIAPETPAPSTFGPLPLALDDRRSKAAQQMERITAAAAIKEFNPRAEIRQGSVWDVLSSAIRRNEIDLLVLGTHGRGGLKKFALGSVAEGVLHLASCPVLTIGPHVPLPDPGPNEFCSILFATDFGPASAKAFPYALSLAEGWGARLVLLHVVPPMPIVDVAALAYCPGPLVAQDLTQWQAARRESSLARLKELVPADAKLVSQPQYIVEMEYESERILAAADAYNADLIVMGANPVSPWAAAHLPWALTHDVVCKAPCPILTVRA